MLDDMHESADSAIRRVDVLIAARDSAETIERAVSSALAQGEVDRVIVVDDGSTDDTTARARQCDPTETRVVIERLPSSFGPAVARNVAIRLATAPWLAILDADDFFLPGRLGILLARSSGCDFVADGLLHLAADRIDHELPPLGNVKSPGVSSLDFEQFVLGNVSRWRSHRQELGYLQPLMRRSFLDEHALRYDERLRFGEDYALYARALAAGARFRLVSIVGYVAVERADSLSARHTRQDLELLKVSDTELMAGEGLTPTQRQAVAKHHADIDRRALWLVLVEALQSRSYRQAASVFLRSPSLTLYLMERLIAEIPLQLRRRARRVAV